MKFFIYDNVNECLTLDDTSILLTKEFATLYDKKRNITTKDKTGTKRELAFKEFKYIYLYLDWKSPYHAYLEQEKHEESLKDSGLTEKEFNSIEFKAACKKYEDIQNSSLSMQMLWGARIAVQNLIHYFKTFDLSERDPVTGKPIFKTKDLIAEIKGCKDVIDGLNDMEKTVQMELEGKSGLRGDTEGGMFDDE